jgi:hypothetical protein
MIDDRCSKEAFRSMLEKNRPPIDRSIDHCGESFDRSIVAENRSIDAFERIVRSTAVKIPAPIDRSHEACRRQL